MARIKRGPAPSSTDYRTVVLAASGTSQRITVGTYSFPFTPDSGPTVTYTMPLYSQRLALPLSLPDRSSVAAGRYIAIVMYLTESPVGGAFAVPTYFTSDITLAGDLSWPEAQQQAHIAAGTRYDYTLSMLGSYNTPNDTPGLGVANQVVATFQTFDQTALNGTLYFQFAPNNDGGGYESKVDQLGFDTRLAGEQERLNNLLGFYGQVIPQNPGTLRLQHVIPPTNQALTDIVFVASDTATCHVDVYEMWDLKPVVPPPSPTTTVCPAHAEWPYVDPTLTISPTRPARIRRSRP